MGDANSLNRKHDTGNTENELIRMLTDLFDERMDGMSKIRKLEGYGLTLTRKVKGEVTDMCTYATAIEIKGIEKGKEKGREEGLRALVQSLREYVPDFESLYKAITRNEGYASVSKEQVMKYYQ